MKQKKITTETIDWNKIYINYPTREVFIDIGTQQQKKITLEKFKELLKKVPSINFLISTIL